MSLESIRYAHLKSKKRGSRSCQMLERRKKEFFWKSIPALWVNSHLDLKIDARRPLRNIRRALTRILTLSLACYVITVNLRMMRLWIRGASMLVSYKTSPINRNRKIPWSWGPSRINDSNRTDLILYAKKGCWQILCSCINSLLRPFTTPDFLWNDLLDHIRQLALHVLQSTLQEWTKYLLQRSNNKTGHFFV